MAPTPPLPVTEDTPPDMLAGSMDLRVVLPNGHSVKMSVERSTPMMDLLVQVTTMNKISTGGHVLQAVGERGILPYKPSTPIGALDAWTIQVVPKLKTQTSTLQEKAPLKTINQQQPFEQTFRLQVHLPRNQLFVMRISPKTLLSDILHLTCTEKNLDPNKYELRHPANLSQLLSPSCTLADYGLQEVTVVGRSRAPGMGSALSSSDIMALQREEDKRRKQARQQHGTGTCTGLGLVFNKRNRSSYCEGSVSSDSLGGRSISPARSDESASRSASPQAPSLPTMMAPVPPARPIRKRRPAPKPPCFNSGPVSSEQLIESNVQAESSSGTVMNGHSVSNNINATLVPVSHSRNSSDSSGYHEASVLSESPAESNPISENCTLPREGRRTSGQPMQMKAQNVSHGLSRSMSSLSGVGNMAGYQHSTSNSSLASSTGQGQKKKKAPPPPPGARIRKGGKQQEHTSSLSLPSTCEDITESLNKTTSLERHLSGKNSAVTNGHTPDKSSTLPGKMKMSQHDHRPVEITAQTSADTPETETQSPEEIFLGGNEKILDVPEETSSIHSETCQDVLTNASKNESPDGDISKTQDKCLQRFPVPPVETIPEHPVELASRSKSPRTVDTSTPQASAALEQEPALQTPVPKPRIRVKPSSLDDTAPLAIEQPVPPLRPTPRSSSSVQEDKYIESAVSDWGNDRTTGKEQKGKHDSVGQTFGVGTTLLMLSHLRTDYGSSGSFEQSSVRSQSSADEGQDSDDDLNISDKDMGMFDGTVEPGNETPNNAAALNRSVDLHDDSVFEYDSENESSGTSSTFKYMPPDRLMRRKGEDAFAAYNEGSCHVTSRNGLQKKVVPEVCGDSSTSLQNVDRVPAFMDNEADTQLNSVMDLVDQVEEAFRSVTVELEATIRQDEDLNSLPPPPPRMAVSSVDDLAVDWEYQLPAPPSAFRDSDSPTLTEGGTVMLADSQVFQEPCLSPEPKSNIHQTLFTTMELEESLDLNPDSQIHRNNGTRINPLFDPRHCDDDREPSLFSDVGKNNTNHIYHQNTRSEKKNTSDQMLRNSDFCKDQSKETSTSSGVHGNQQPVSFTLTSYRTSQRPRDTDKVFNREGENDRAHSVQHSSTGSSEITRVLQHNYSSASSLNSNSAGQSRKNSFSNSDINFKPRGPVSVSSVKRSTSCVSLLSKPLSHHNNYIQSGQNNIPFTNRTTSVGNLTAEAQLDRDKNRTYETLGLWKTTSEHNVSQHVQERVQNGTKSYSRVEEQKNVEVGREEQRSSQQQQIIPTDGDHARFLALQEQYLQLQEQLHYSGFMQQQQLSQLQSTNADAPLQSPQVLRSILPQLNQTEVSRGNQAINQQQESDSLAFSRTDIPPTKLTPNNEDLSYHHSPKDTISVTSNQQNTSEKSPNGRNSGEGKRYKYHGPPAINFATWSERPKSQVTIKMDRDYRIGIGQADRIDECNETPARTGNSESRNKTLVVERNHHIETLQQSPNYGEIGAQNKENNKAYTSQHVTKVEPVSLTMRLISHTTASGFRKPVAGASQKAGSSSYTAEQAHKLSKSDTKDITGSSTIGLQIGHTFQQSDPSRVPIVRAVELKKSFIQQQNMQSSSHCLHKSSTMLNSEEERGHCDANMVDQSSSTSQHSRGSDETVAVQTFAGVNFLAKRFSGDASSSNGLPSFSTSLPFSSYGEDGANSKRYDSSTSSLPYDSTLPYRSVNSTNLNASNVNTYQDTRFKKRDGRDIQRHTSVIGISGDSDHTMLSSFHEPTAESKRAQSGATRPSVVRVNGFAAPKQLMPVVKGFQFASAAANRDTIPTSPTKNSNTSSHHTPVQRSESISAIRNLRTVDTTDHPSSETFGKVKTYVRRNSNESRPEPVITKITTTAESKPPPPPPIAVSLRKSTVQPRPKSLPPPQLNPRDELMNAIRNFGGREKLKHVCDNRDSSLTVLIQ